MRLINEEIVRIEKVIERYKNPALMVSFGKDSTVLLDLLGHLNLPIICHKTPWHPHRWKHANFIIQKEDLTIYDWPPEFTALQEKDGQLELVSGYSIGNGKVIGVRQRVVNTGGLGERNLCGLHDCLRRPAGTIAHQWDLLITGQKNGDTDHFGGKHEVLEDIKQTGGTADVYFPLRNWTDEEIWEYIKENDLPYDILRYHPGNEDSCSSDVVQGCFKCVDRNADRTVTCPRLNGLEVSNISSQIPYLSISTSI